MGKFVISDSSEGYRFLLKSSRGEIIGLGPYCETKAKIDEKRRYVERNVVSAPIEDSTGKYPGSHNNPKFVIFKDENDMYRYNFLDEKGDCILTSTAYLDFDRVVKTIANVRQTIRGHLNG